MIKSLLILLLLVILIAGAALTRPSEDSFKTWYRAQSNATSGGNLLQQVASQALAESALKQYSYHNRFLWTDVQRNGQTAYTGVFGHWFSRSAAAAPSPKPAG